MVAEKRMNELLDEAELLTSYLVGKPGNILMYEQYVSGITLLNLSLTTREERMMLTLKKFSFLLPFCDAGLAILSPQCTFRKRLLLLFALIETDKQFTDDIINTKDSDFGLIRFIIRGCIGVLKSVIGVVLVLLMQWK